MNRFNYKIQKNNKILFCETYYKINLFNFYEKKLNLNYIINL